MSGDQSNHAENKDEKQRPAQRDYAKPQIASRPSETTKHLNVNFYRWPGDWLNPKEGGQYDYRP